VRHLFRASLCPLRASSELNGRRKRRGLRFGIKKEGGNGEACVDRIKWKEETWRCALPELKKEGGIEEACVMSHTVRRSAPVRASPTKGIKGVFTSRKAGEKLL
jgi:hypothetical protein